MAKIDLNNMSVQDLQKLEKEIAVRKAQTSSREVEDLRNKFSELAGKKGYTLAQVMGGVKTRKSGPVKAKYRNPKDASQTWSGRGRRPLWLEAELKKGRSINHFAI